MQKSAYVLSRHYESIFSRVRLGNSITSLRVMMCSKLNSELGFMTGITVGLWAFSVLPSILFYSLYHTIPDSVTLTYVTLFLLTIYSYLERKKILLQGADFKERFK